MERHLTLKHQEVSGVLKAWLPLMNEDALLSITPSHDLSIAENFLLSYYEALLEELVIAMGEGRTCTIGSPVLLKYLDYSCQEAQPQAVARPSLSTDQLIAESVSDILSVSVPDVSRLSCEDVLVLRDAVRDELEAFRDRLHAMARAVMAESGAPLRKRLAQELLAKVQGAVKDLELKMRGLTTSAIAEVMKSTVACAALAAHCLPDLAASSRVLGSIGFSCLQTALHRYGQHQQLSGDGMYYMVKLKRFHGQ